MYIETFKKYYLNCNLSNMLCAMIALTRVPPLQIINSFTIQITNTSTPGQLTSHGRWISGHSDTIYLELMFKV